MRIALKGENVMRRVLWVLPLVLMMAGCAFQRDWDAAGKVAADGEGRSLAGRWEGQWLSNKNDHNGKLKAAILSAEKPAEYRAHFHAVYGGIFTFDYPVVLVTVREESGNTRFNGSADLGPMAGGVYTYTGQVTGEHFRADYKSKYDHGRFELVRVKGK